MERLRWQVRDGLPTGELENNEDKYMKVLHKLLLLGLVAAFWGCKVDDEMAINLALGEQTLTVTLRTEAEPEPEVMAVAGPLADDVDPGEEPTDPDTDPEPDPEPEPDLGLVDAPVSGTYELKFGDEQLLSALQYYRSDEVALTVSGISLDVVESAGNPSEEFRDLVIAAYVGDTEIARYEKESVTEAVSEDEELNAFVAAVMARIQVRETVRLDCSGVFVGYRVGVSSVAGGVALTMDIVADITVKR